MISIDQHALAVLSANQACLHVLSIMPESDLLDELFDIMERQFEVMYTMFENKHYGTNNLINYQNKIENLITQVKSLEKQRDQS